MYAVEGLALPRASHSGRVRRDRPIGLSSAFHARGSARFFAHAVATVVDIGRMISLVKLDMVRWVFAAPPRIIAPAPITAMTPEDSAPVVHHTHVLCSGELVWNMFALQALSL